MKKYILPIVSLILASVCFLLYLYAEKNSILWLSLLLGSIISIPIELFWKNIINLFRRDEGWIGSLSKLLKEKDITNETFIRISFAYLYRININGKYLLVKNGRNFKKYQPVGGAYKCYTLEKEILTSIKYGVVDDDFIDIDETSKNDYRMRVPAKNLKRFVRRFKKTKNRENVEDLSREFKEELISTKILSKKNFKEIKYKFCGRNCTDVRYSQFNDCYELLIADIIELIPTSKQEQELSNLQSITNDKYMWATENEIITCGVKKRTKKMTPAITDHSFKILPVKENLLTDRSNKIYTVTIK